jgi:hypothetical protein
LIDVNALISDKFFGVDDSLLVLVDEWRVPAPPVVPDFIEFLREDLDLFESWLEFLWLSTAFCTNYTDGSYRTE